MPVMFAGNMYLTPTPDDYPANHARIGLQNVLKAAVITATYQSGFHYQNAVSDLTYDLWRPTSVASPVVFEAVLDQGYELDYFGIAAHDLGFKSGTVKLEYYDGVSSWIEVVPETLIESDDPVMVIFDKVFAGRVRFTFTAASVFVIGVLYLGKAFAFERPFFIGHRPLSLNRTTAIEHKITEKGVDVGRYVVKKGATTKVTVNNQSPSFIRTKFLPMMIEARTRGFFFAWRPTTYPNDIAFCWTRENVKPKNNGRKELMDIDFTVKAI